MSTNIEQRLEQIRVVPIIQADDPSTALRTTEALIKGGLDVMEVVLRTDAAIECIRHMVAEFDSAIIGAGTVLNVAQAQQVQDVGAEFLVSPGLDKKTVRFAQKNDMPIYPGVGTATEVQKAYNLGLQTVKVFPAGVVGGIPALKAFGSVFRTLRFMPTGGVSAANLAEYLAVPSVLACGGSWLAPKALAEAGEYDEITARAAKAVAIGAAANQ